jgi:hypothetical protein
VKRGPGEGVEPQGRRDGEDDQGQHPRPGGGEGEGLAGGHVELLGAGAEGITSAARPLPLLVQLTCQRPLGGRGPEPGSPDQVANEEQPDQSHGQHDLPGSTGSVSHDPIHSS